MIKRFDDFSTSPEFPKNKAGVVIKYGNNILVAHATNSSWQNRPFGIPKGNIDFGEDEKTAAVRELYEEVGIQVDSNILGPAESFTLFSNSGKPIGVLTYFVLTIENLSEIGLASRVLPKSMLQLKEVDWAGFIPIEDAYEKLYKSQLIILDRIRE